MVVVDSMPVKSMRDTVAVVTGGAQGIGRAIASALAVSGRRVVVTDVLVDPGRETVAALSRQGSAAEFEELDISDSGAVASFFARLEERLGRLDVLVNNAAVAQPVSKVSCLSDGDWNRVLRINLSGTFLCSRAALAIMRPRKSGSIVNVASLNALWSPPLVSAYNSSKAAVLELTRSLAQEVARDGIRVNAVNPGPVLTQLNRTVLEQRALSSGRSLDEIIEGLRRSIPLGRWGETVDVARAVAFLAGPESSWMTGEVLNVGGGLQGLPPVFPVAPAAK